MYKKQYFTSIKYLLVVIILVITFVRMEVKNKIIVEYNYDIYVLCVNIFFFTIHFFILPPHFTINSTHRTIWRNTKK